ncbi:MAG: hypothetical protein HQ515_16505, partial [Phycisphaeraceae bacterium]|nr:hypothetical protein [Phycisphaeraceae bacterium]
ISDPCRRAYALGMMAQALAGSDKTGAGRLVQEAFVVLTECVSNPQQRPRTLPPTPQDVGLSLLPVVESIDAGLVQEYFWRTASLCKYRRYVTVACLGRYDPSLASQWLTHSGSRASGSRVQDYPSFYFAAVTQLDPEATVGLVAGLPEDSEEQRKGKLQAWTQVIEMITRNSRERWEWILDKEMHLWHVGKKDI